MLENLDLAPADPILGLTEAFKADTNPQKINLGVGVYKDEAGQTPIMPSVRRAEEIILGREKSKTYLSIPGMPEYGKVVRELLFGADCARAVTAHTPGGTGALRVAGDFLRPLRKGKLWVSQPTWENHKAVFSTVGFEVAAYPYYDPRTRGLDFPAMLSALKAVSADDVVLLHACCHNPSGIDPTAEQWDDIAATARSAGWLPLIDFAYQGLAEGIDDDAVGVRILTEAVDELLICSSFSKNFSLYNDRVGALTLVAADAEVAARAFSHLKITIRRNYSNPPAHGGLIVTTIWNDPKLKTQWLGELDAMRQRIHQMRELFVATLKAKGVKQDFSFIAHQKGMFSFSGLTKDQVHALRDKYAIYMVDSGRMNVAGMTPDNMDRLCAAIADILR